MNNIHQLSTIHTGPSHPENQLPLNVLLGRKIRQIRTTLGLSQEAFAFEVGLHRTYIGQIERAEKNITVKNIEKICLALDIDPKELFDFSNLL